MLNIDIVMTHTYHQHIYHLVWSTNEREPLITPTFKQNTFEFLGGAFKTAGCVPLEIGGVSDHIHALVGIPPRCAVSEIIRDVKICSTKWFNRNHRNTQKFSWQEGFGSFTVSTSQVDAVRTYILNQETHHKKMTFQEEFIRFLKIHQIEFDEKFLWR